MKQKLLLMLLATIGLMATAAPRVETVSSPNGKIRIDVTIGDQLQYSVYNGDELILKDNVLSLQVGKELFGANPDSNPSSAPRSMRSLSPWCP